MVPPRVALKTVGLFVGNPTKAQKHDSPVRPEAAAFMWFWTPDNKYAPAPHHSVINSTRKG